MRDRIVFLISLFLLASVAWGQQQPSGGNAQPSAAQSMPGMDMPGHDMSNMKGMSMGADKDDKDTDAGMHAMHSMEGHMDMGPHMKMTALRPAQTRRRRARSASSGSRAQSFNKIHRLPRRAGRRLQDFPS